MEQIVISIYESMWTMSPNVMTEGTKTKWRLSIEMNFQAYTWKARFAYENRNDNISNDDNAWNSL